MAPNSNRLLESASGHFEEGDHVMQILCKCVVSLLPVCHSALSCKLWPACLKVCFWPACLKMCFWPVAAAGNLLMAVLLQLQGLLVLVQMLQQGIRDLHIRRQCHHLLGKALCCNSCQCQHNDFVTCCKLVVSERSSKCLCFGHPPE